MLPKVAIVIVTYNGSRYIVKCLTSVFSNKYEGQLSVIVVDNSSFDDTVSLVAANFPQADLIKLDANRGFVGGNNVGIGRAMEQGCDYVVLLNQDTKVEGRWLEELVKAAEDDKVGIVQAMLLLASEKFPLLAKEGVGGGSGEMAEEPFLTNNVGNALHYLGFGFVKHYREPYAQWRDKAPFEIGYASGAAMLIKKEVLEKIALAPLTLPSPSGRGGYKSPLLFESLSRVCRGKGVGLSADLSAKALASVEAASFAEVAMEAGLAKAGGGVYLNSLFFAYHEDLDLCWRARLLGYKIIIAPKAIVYHYYEFSRNKNKFYLTERNRWICLIQNYSFKTLLLLSPMLVTIELMMLGYSLLSGWLAGKLKSYGWLVAHWRAILWQRRRVQSMRLVSDRQIMQQMESRLEFSEVSNPVLRYVVSPVAEWYYRGVKRLIG